MQELTKSLRHPKLAFREIPVTQLRGGQYQPRQTFCEEGLKSLAETIKRVGVLEPLLVRPLAASAYEIVAGERRWRAARIACLKTVPCLVGYYSDEQASQVALIENMSREDLNPIDEAAGINRIVLEFDYTHEEVGAILGKTRSHITNLLRLLKLDHRVQEWLMAGEISEAHGKILAGLPIEKQYFFASKCIEKHWSMRVLSKEIKSATEKNKESPKHKDKKDVDILRLEQEVSDKFGHQVKFCFDKNKSGVINIHFCNFDELEGVLAKLKSIS
jgi:ParB family transcriptional regulator, chromosome partitioning protein